MTKAMAQHQIHERIGEKPPMTAHIEHEEGCTYTPDFLARLKEACPDAKITTSVGEGECWEFFLNEKCVHSRRLLYGNSFPDMDEMIEISLQMNEGRSFMHMYLCTYMEGGEIKMVKEDKLKTPLAKRVILSCTIQ